MKYRPELFRDDYNLDALQRVQPQGHSFEMLVTPRFRSHYFEHRFEPLTAALIRSISPRKQVFVDVGANYGFYSILAGRRNPELEIHALEPVPENFEILRRNLELNGLESVRCHQLAASDKKETATFLRSMAADNSSFYAHPQAPPLDKIEVETLPLSHFLKDHRNAATLIKIDTDGHEVPILEGLRDSLSPAQDATLVVEFNPVMQEQAGHDPVELLALLSDMHFTVFMVQEDPYRLIRIDPASPWQPLVGSGGYANLYCRPKASALSLCFFSHSHALAGAERSLSELVGQLIEDQGAVCNVVIPGDGPLRPQIEAVGAGVIAAEYGWWCSTAPTGAIEARQTMGDDLARLLVQTVPEVAAVRPDVVCTNSLVIPYGALTAGILRLPHIWNAHEYGQKDHGYRFYMPFDQILEFVKTFSDFVFGPSRTLLQELFPDLGQNRSDHLYPVIEAPTSPATFVSQSTTSVPMPVRLIDFSTLTERKQQETAVRAVAKLAARGLDATLLLMGPQDSAYVSFLEKLSESLNIESRIVIKEYCDDVWPAIDRADMIVVSAPAHAFGRVAVEGMLRAKPVIYPRQTGIAEYMEDGRTGLGFTAGDAEAMADQIERLIRDPELCRQIGVNAQSAARQLFSRQESGGKFMARALQIKRQGPAERPALPPAIVSSFLTGIQRLNRERSELGSQFQERSEELAAVRSILETRDTEIADIKVLVAARDKELTSIKPILEARQEELADLKSLLVARDDELASVKPALEARNEELTALKDTLEERHGELTAIKPVLAARDDELAAIKPVLAARDDELAAIKPVLAARDEELAAIQPVLAARDEELAAIQPVLAARDEELAAIKPVLMAREEEVADLELSREHQAAEIQDLSVRLEETRELLDRLRSSLLGKLALWITRKK